MTGRGLEARLGRVVGRLLTRGGGLGFPAGPLAGWPEAERRRLDRMVEAGGAAARAALDGLSDADLRWIVDSGSADDRAGAEETAADAVGPGGR